LELVTGIIVLPQRQTALVARQAAEVDVLTNGRFRLGVGVGWNAFEFDALGKDFTTRGQRMDEQIELLRRLWIDRSVTFEADDEHLSGVGINPRPIQRPIPIWLGATSPVAYRRIGRLADGWFPRVVPGPQLDEARAIIHHSATASGRDPGKILMECQLTWTRDADEVAATAQAWRAAGASHAAITTMGAGLASVDDHIEAIATAAASFGIAQHPTR
jgi:probable F420-dependent oxidoreductase